MAQQDFVGSPRLIALGGGSTVAQIPLGRDLVVGRAPTCDIQFDGPNVSRRHARLVRDGGHVWLEDLRSRCGTTVNGQPVTDARELLSGDEVAFATFRLRFVDGSDDATTVPTAPTETAPVPKSPALLNVDHQDAGTIYNAEKVYISPQEHESFLREITATRTRARGVIWTGAVMVCLGVGMFAVGVMRFLTSIPTATSGLEIDPFGWRIFGIPSGLLGWGLALIGMMLLVLGTVLHVVATSRRRGFDRKYQVSPGPYRDKS
jgi:pSer/pThr/pTyr-binding forkhead associated (FHA) protein